MASDWSVASNAIAGAAAEALLPSRFRSRISTRLRRAANEKSPGAAEALLLIDTDLDGVKPQNVARIPSLVTGPPQGPQEPRVYPVGASLWRIESVPQ